MPDLERDELAPEQLAWPESGLLPAIAQDRTTGEVLMLAWMDAEALRRTLATRRATYFSRSRGAYWVKGETSGNVQDVLEVRYDCDADALLLTIDQRGAGACHTGARSCFYRTLPMEGAPVTDKTTAPGSAEAPVPAGEPAAAPGDVPSLGAVLEDLAALLESRRVEQPEGSYTVKLLTGPQDKLLKKIAEESGEVIIAARDHDIAQTRYEIADLLYHLLVVMTREGISPADLAAELASRRK